MEERKRCQKRRGKGRKEERQKDISAVFCPNIYRNPGNRNYLHESAKGLEETKKEERKRE